MLRRLYLLVCVLFDCQLLWPAPLAGVMAALAHAASVDDIGLQRALLFVVNIASLRVYRVVGDDRRGGGERGIQRPVCGWGVVGGDV